MTLDATPDDRPAWAPRGPDRPASGAVGLWGVPKLTLHRVGHPRWTLPPLRIAALADPHVNWPFVRPRHIQQIVAATNALGADMIVLLGDYLPDRYMLCRHLHAEAIVPLWTPLSAPLGVWAIMGNHDYHDDPRARVSEGRDSAVVDAFARIGHPLLRNDRRRIDHGGGAFWLVTLDSQRALERGQPGLEDPAAAYAGVPEDAPVILLAHEPDYFGLGDPRPVLQLSGHTHGGQGVIFGRRPMVPSRYGDRYAIGHIVEAGRHLVVSAGIGYSGLPLRLGVPSEITLIELRADKGGET